MQHRARVLLVGLCLSGPGIIACTPAEPSGGSSGSGGQSTAGGQGGATGNGGTQARGGNTGSGGSQSEGSGGSSAGGRPGTGGTPSGGGGGGGSGSGGNTGPGSGGSPAGGGGAGGAVRPDAAAETGARPDATTMPPAGDAGAGDPKFSFFVTSLDGMRRLSKSQNGFGGDLRFGEANGLAGADKICQTLATDVGAGNKTWRAFLSVVRGPDGMQVDAADRIGDGPWYDRRGRLIAMNKAGLIGTFNRPMGDSATVNDLPDETGQGTRRLGDTHDVITGSNMMGRLRTPGNLANTCQDWTSTMGTGTIGFGHAWPAGSGMHWIQVHTGRSCAAGVNLVQNGGGDGSSIGAGGGWGAIYCFALASTM
ncbi:MAG TPA: hypothetical protein VGG33_26865 [Polyangia bacterium]